MCQIYWGHIMIINWEILLGAKCSCYQRVSYSILWSDFFLPLRTFRFVLFSVALINLLFCFFRRVKLFSLEGCSLLTTEGLESVIETWKVLESLRVVSCKNIKDSDISPALATLFTSLKELKWRPDTKHLLQSSCEDISMGKKGGRFFKRTSMQSESRPWF